jgi:hypothetical protein
MRLLRLAWLGPVGLIFLALLPVTGATAPVFGTVTTCASTSSCTFVFNTSAGTGWATTTSKLMSFQLPGELKASYNLSYSTYIQRLTGTYTYWTVGNFLGTDVNTGKVVYGTTNTNYTITAHCTRGCYYTYTTDNGTIAFRFTRAELTSTSVSCTPSTIKVTGKTACTVAVTNLWNASNVPAGKIHLSGQGLGVFASHGNCVLAAGQCTLNWHPYDNTGGYVIISGTYFGSAAYYKSASSTVITVTGGG